ncbi:MAG: hypothetical protein WBS54_02650 [Acidobacteriota bacterium]
MVRSQGRSPDTERRPPRATGAAIPLLIVVLGVLFGSRPLSAAPIPVRFAEGSIHGFLVLRTQEGRFLAQGDLLEVVRGADIQKTTVFRFADGSLFKETVVFTQQGVYTLQSYRLEQRGPAFTEDTTLFLERATGKYRVETRSHAGGPEKVLEGTLDLPPDVYNGMIPTIVKDIPKGASETVHFVAFMPEPRIIQLEITPSGEQKLMVGKDTMTAVHYVLKAKLGTWLKIFATLLGRTPKDAHAWVIDGDVPAFVGFEGQLYPADPVWRIELLSPTLP